MTGTGTGSTSSLIAIENSSRFFAENPRLLPRPSALPRSGTMAFCSQRYINRNWGVFSSRAIWVIVHRLPSAAFTLSSVLVCSTTIPSRRFWRRWPVVVEIPSSTVERVPGCRVRRLAPDSLDVVESAAGSRRSIPAREGQPGSGSPFRLSRPAHTTSSGAHRPRLFVPAGRSGFTPASAGVGLLQRLWRWCPAVHRRCCGADRFSCSVPGVRCGSSPLAWGNRMTACERHAELGSIPARAGYTRCARRSWTRRAVHPRWCRGSRRAAALYGALSRVDTGSRGVTRKALAFG